MEAIFIENLSLRLEKFLLLGRDLNRYWLEQSLNLYRPTCLLLSRSLKKDPLMCGMLFNEVQAIRSFGSDVGVLELTYNPQDWQLRAGLRTLLLPGQLWQRGHPAASRPGEE